MDCRHLLVIFSGFGLHSNFTYDFSGKSLDSVPSHILWIKDDFKGNCCYYLCCKMDFSFEEAIVAFIDHICREHVLDRNNVTLLGGSKGGSAALYFGLKYSFANVISSAPQIRIGSFIEKVHADIAEHMMRSPADREALDVLIPHLTERTQLENLYLISSPCDGWETCMDFHPRLRTVRNFCHIVTDSSCVWQHNMITSYNVPTILSIVLANSQGMHPHFGEWVHNGIPASEDAAAEKLLARQKAAGEAFACLTSCAFADGKMYPEGAAFIRGIPCPDYGLFSRALLLTSEQDGTEQRFPLGAVKNTRYSKTYFKHAMCDYTAAGFATFKKEGISPAFSAGSYRMSMEITGQGCRSVVPLVLEGSPIIGSMGDKLIRIIPSVSADGCSIIQVIPSISNVTPDIFKLTGQWKRLIKLFTSASRREHRLHYEGEFLKYGVELEDWKDVTFWLVLRSAKKTYVFEIGKNHRPQLNRLFNGFGIYQKSNFCTIKREGVDVALVQSDRYDVFITMLHKGSTFSQKIESLRLP